jgi:hypothetical protein
VLPFQGCAKRAVEAVKQHELVRILCAQADLSKQQLTAFLDCRTEAPSLSCSLTDVLLSDFRTRLQKADPSWKVELVSLS